MAALPNTKVVFNEEHRHSHGEKPVRAHTSWQDTGQNQVSIVAFGEWNLFRQHQLFRKIAQGFNEALTGAWSNQATEDNAKGKASRTPCQ
jgi:hypothetical protein